MTTKADPDERYRLMWAAADAIERWSNQSIRALIDWIETHPPVNAEGEPMVWPDGRPVAEDVLRLLGILSAYVENAP